MRKTFSIQRLMIVSAFASLVFGFYATGALGQSAGGPASGPPVGNTVMPVHTGAYQYKPGVIGAQDIFLSQFFRDRLKAAPLSCSSPDPVTGVVICDVVKYVALGDVSPDILGPAISKRGAPRRYHVELSRVTPPRGPDFCESLDTDPPCSVDVSAGTTAPIVRTLHILNRDLIDSFCGDEDGCRVILGLKSGQSTRTRQVYSLGMHYLSTNEALFNRCVTSSGDITYCRSRYTSAKRLSWAISNGVSGINANTTPTIGINVLSRCLLTDGDTLSGDTLSVTDALPHFSIVNQGSDPQGISVCTLDVWDE